MNLDALNLEALRPVLPLPLAAKLGILAGTAVAVLAIYFFSFLSPLLDQIAAEESKIETKQVNIEKAKIKVKRLPQRRAELASLGKDLQIALSLLPPKAEIPKLLESISWAASDANVEFSTIKIRSETIKAIYAEVPVDISLKGSYRELLSFLVKVGELDRIVSIQKLKISSGSKPGELKISGLLMTYRFVESSATSKTVAQGR
ncbi:MAG: type 4a pilus biogenesis protein PilO [Mariprofundaceae bacterium]|nr:type 4a pilus biogenesis protein PilO [Mariprofundaceae bacterium]